MTYNQRDSEKLFASVFVPIAFRELQPGERELRVVACSAKFGRLRAGLLALARVATRIYVNGSLRYPFLSSSEDRQIDERAAANHCKH
jgi:hypothetical protein